MLLVINKKKQVNYLGGWKEDQTFLGILGSVVSILQSSVGWMSKSVGRWSVGVGRRHPMTMRKVSFRMLSIKRVRTLRHQTDAKYSAVEQKRERAAQRSVLAPVPHPELTSFLSCVTREDSIYTMTLDATERERSVKFYQKIRFG